MSRRQQHFSHGSANVRCATLMGHVDHGKSSYADSLLASNAIISARQAGKLRYLDSREDEQERGITMESSAVSLSFKTRRMGADGVPSEVQDCMINLIDTPGHVDFSSEVSTASRLCDGSLIIVDVVEGVCTQTIMVLRQAWSERLTPILVLNKMDRLVTELKLSPSEAYHHLTQLIEQVNAVMGSFFATERMDDDARWHEERERRLQSKREAQGEKAMEALSADADDADERYEELDDEDIYFDPSRGNVIFASAMDTWAFRLERFSQLYAKKLGIEERKFRNVLWGDFYFDPKAKRVVSQKQKEKMVPARNLKPVFVQFVLDNIWSVYESAEQRDQEKIERIVKTLELKILPRDLRSKDTTGLVQSIFSQWLPLASCTFGALMAIVPSPVEAQRRRIPKMLHPELSYFANVEPRTVLERDLFGAQAGKGARRCAYVSKMFAVRRADLPEGRRHEVTAEEMRQRGREARERAQAMREALSATGATLNDDGSTEIGDVATTTTTAPATDELTEEQKNEEVVLGFARLYSGVLAVGQTITAVLPKYNAALSPQHASNVRYSKTVAIEALYMMMGRELVGVSEVPAGNVFAVRGLEGVVLRNATLCGLPVDDAADMQADDVVNLAGVNRLSSPIVRVALEPRNPSHMPKLVEGLRLLNQADPCVETRVQSTGEHVIVCAGELHLERCLKDLRERFAKCAITASAPLVPFRETAVRAAEMAPTKTQGALRGTVNVSTGAGGHVALSVRAVPMPDDVTQFLLANGRTVKRLLQRAQRQGGAQDDDEDDEGLEQTASTREVKMDGFWQALVEVLGGTSRGGDAVWKDAEGVVERVWALGPRRTGPNLLIDARKDAPRHRSLRAQTSRNEQHTDQDDVVDALADGVSALDVQQQASKSAAAWTLNDVEEALGTGFQLATLQGPMCAEQMQGMAFFVERIDVQQQGQQDDDVVSHSQLTSAVIASAREACRAGLLDWSPRLMMAMYTCDIQASTEVLGKVHAVLARRRGRITSEEMKEGTSFFTVGARLPVVESFGFADEIRTRTSGAASPQLVFSGFETFDMDPYWVPRTDEELEDFGQLGERENVAKRYMDRVRKRKGLFVSERIVEGEKQRTLKSN